MFIGGNGRNPSEIAALRTSQVFCEEMHFLGGNGRNPSEIATLRSCQLAAEEKALWVGGELQSSPIGTPRAAAIAGVSLSLRPICGVTNSDFDIIKLLGLLWSLK